MFQVKETAIGSLRYTGRSKAIIEDNIDPQKRGRVRVRHPLLGDKSYWIPYLTAPGVFSAPRIGDIVYVEAEAGDHNHPVAWGNLPKKGGGAIPDEFLRSEPTNRGMYTPNNHLFEMDDGQTLAGTGKGIRITTSGATGEGHKFHLIDDVAETGILLSDSLGNQSKLDTLTNKWTWSMVAGTTITLDGATDLWSAEAALGDKISVSALDGVQISTPAAGGTSASFKAGMVEIDGTLGFKASEGTGGATVNLANGLIGIGNSSAELLDLFDQFLDIVANLATAMSTETHVGNLGYPTAPPTNAADYIKAGVEINTKIKAKLALIKGSV